MIEPVGTFADRILPRILTPDVWTNFEGVFIDCDGTLVKSDPLIDKVVSRAVTQALQQRGRPAFEHTPRENKSRFRGQTFPEILTARAKEQDVTIPDDELEALQQTYEIEKCRVLLKAPAAHGARRVLKRLRKSGKRFALVSSSSPPAIEACLQGAGLSEFFPAELIFSAHDCPKPSPDSFLRAMRELGVSSERSIAIEDSGSGVRAALAAKMWTVAYGGCLTIDEQCAHVQKCCGLGANAYMHHWDELLQILLHASR